MGAGRGFNIIVRVPLVAGHAPVAFVVKVRITVPVSPATGVYVTVAGVDV